MLFTAQEPFAVALGHLQYGSWHLPPQSPQRQIHFGIPQIQRIQQLRATSRVWLACSPGANGVHKQTLYVLERIGDSVSQTSVLRSQLSGPWFKQRLAVRPELLLFFLQQGPS